MIIKRLIFPKLSVLFFFILSFFIMHGIGKATEPLASHENNKFKVFDGTLYSNKPDLSSFGIHQIKIIYHKDLWREGQDDSNVPDPIRLKYAAKPFSANGSPVAVIDIEHWLVTQANGQFSKENFEKHLKVINTLHRLSPNMQFGYFGIPIQDYWRAINGQGKIEAPLWQAENDRMMPIVDAQDVVFPVLYTFYADREAWVKFAMAQLIEARRLAKGKPVYAFLWPQYHGSNHILGYDYLHPDYWKMELDTVKKYADGIVIWGGYKEEWNDNAPWWQATKEFMKSINK